MTARPTTPPHAPRRHKRRPRAVAALLALLAAAPAIPLAACVTEGADADDRTLGAASRSQFDRLRTGQRRAGAVDLSEPVARPALAATTIQSKVSVRVQPIGDLPYDGQVLPIISPDGRFAAAQTGDAPTWPTILAQDGAAAPRTRIKLFDLTQSPPREMRPAQPHPEGLLLGRAADERGVLVEYPRPDGARWIGRVAWLSGRLEWLVRDANVNAHAVFGPRGELAWSRRDLMEPHAAIVLRADAQDHLIRPARNASLAFPTFGTTGQALYTFSISSDALWLRALRLRPEADGGVEVGGVVARRRLAAGGGMLSAYQSIISVQQRPALGPWADAPGLLLVGPATARVELFDLATGSMTPLAPKSIAACPADTGALAVYITTPDGLAHQLIQRRRAAFPEALPAAKVLGDAYVPRATTDADRPIILIGPSPGDIDRLRLIGLSAAD